MRGHKKQFVNGCASVYDLRSCLTVARDHANLFSIDKIGARIRPRINF